jgi:hypothetical protein
MITQELLHGADGHARIQGQGLTGLAGQVREQAATIDAQQIKGLRVATTEEEGLEIIGKGGAQFLNLFRCQNDTSGLAPEVEGANCIPAY